MKSTNVDYLYATVCLLSVVILILDIAIAANGWLAGTFITVTIGILVSTTLFKIHETKARRKENDDFYRESIAVMKSAGVATDLSRKAALEMSILNVCLETIDQAIENEPHQRLIWETRKKVCENFQRLLKTQMEFTPPPVLTDAQREHVLTTHPLLRGIDDYPPDPAQRYSETAWYKEIQEKVHRFTDELE